MLLPIIDGSFQELWGSFAHSLAFSSSSVVNRYFVLSICSSPYLPVIEHRVHEDSLFACK